jgi:hypothetical protein
MAVAQRPLVGEDACRREPVGEAPGSARIDARERGSEPDGDVLAEHWERMDELGGLRQLGVVP